jgi:capsular polysaccharide biosynthesis protein
MSQRFLAVANQGGLPVVQLNIALLEAIHARRPKAVLALAVLTRADAEFARASALVPIDIVCFEERRKQDSFNLATEVVRLATEYSANWSAVIASERAFIDASLLLGGAGGRHEDRAYVERLLVDFVRFFESILRDPFDLVIAQTPDTLMTYVLYKVAEARRQMVRGLSPAWLSDQQKPAGFLTKNEFLHAPAMHETYDALLKRNLSQDEIARADRFRKTILTFDGNKAFHAVTGKSFGRSALSPNARRLLEYLRTNAKRKKEVEFFKIDPLSKAKANIFRLWRKGAARKWLGSADTPIPPKSVFYPLHFQPEASTLVGGIFYANQMGLIEAIAKSLPLGWTLVLKEHPAGRGARPEWQYRYMSHYPNVMFSDRLSRDIVKACDAVVTITGTIAIEAMALDKPVVVFGNWFYDYADVFYRLKSFDALPSLLRRLLIDREYEKRTDRVDLVRKFLLSYLQGLVPAHPRAESAGIYADALIAVAEAKQSVSLVPERAVSI